MNADELREWVAFHKSIHPDFSTWANSQPDESRRQLAEEWARILEPITPDEAKCVSRRLLSGELEPLTAWEYGREWNMLAAFVRKHAVATSVFRMSASCNLSGRELTYRCHHCRDTGFREVYHPKSVRAVAVGKLDPTLPGEARRLRTCNVACDCESGRRLVQAQEGRWNGGRQYSAKHHCDCQGGDVVEHGQRLAQWLDEVTSVEAMPNYQQAFADHNSAAAAAADF